MEITDLPPVAEPAPVPVASAPGPVWYSRLLQWEYSFLCLMVLLTLALHFIVINSPPEIMFDEQHYVPDAKQIIDGNPSGRSEHPSLAKLFVVAGLLIFGDNPYGWRVLPVLFGTAIIVFFYLICRKAGMPRLAANIAIFLLVLENMTFVQASLAMLDVFTLFFMVVSFWLYLRGNYPVSAVMAGLAAQTKLFGVFVVIAIFVHWLVVRRNKKWHFLAAVFLVPLTFIETMPLFDYFIYGYLVSPIERIKSMFSLSSSLTFEAFGRIDMSRPWEWVLRPQGMSYWYTPHYISAVNINVWVLIIPAVAYMIFRAVKRDNAAFFGVLWFASTYLVWIPMSLILDRISFVYYFYPTVGAVCMGIGIGLAWLIDFWRSHSTGKLRWAAISAAGVYLALHVIVFSVMWPFSWLPWVKLIFTKT